MKKRYENAVLAAALFRLSNNVSRIFYKLILKAEPRLLLDQAKSSENTVSTAPVTILNLAPTCGHTNQILYQVCVYRELSTDKHTYKMLYNS